MANKLVQKFTQPTDSFNAVTLFHIFFSVLIMSVLLTVIGTWVGTRSITMKPIQTLVAQPIARLAMTVLHKSQAQETTMG